VGPSLLLERGVKGIAGVAKGDTPRNGGVQKKARQTFGAKERGKEVNGVGGWGGGEDLDAK